MVNSRSSLSISFSGAGEASSCASSESMAEGLLLYSLYFPRSLMNSNTAIITPAPIKGINSSIPDIIRMTLNTALYALSPVSTPSRAYMTKRRIIFPTDTSDRAMSGRIYGKKRYCVYTVFVCRYPARSIARTIDTTSAIRYFKNQVFFTGFIGLLSIFFREIINISRNLRQKIPGSFSKTAETTVRLSIASVYGK